MKTSTADILKWFTGKPREKAEHALSLLIESEAEGQWIPGASRKVRAALGKHNVAAKLSKQIGSVLDNLRTPAEEKGYGRGQGATLVSSAMYYGNFGSLVHISIPKLEKLAKTPDQKAALKSATAYYNDFLEVAELTALLDATRPAPVFTSIGVSRTITKTLSDASLNLNTATIRVCPSERFRLKVTKLDKYGKEFECWETYIRLLWPKGTKFNESRFTGHKQCQSCGHAIHNPFNWVPILIDSKAGIPHALWIGRDCAQTVFGIKVTGEIKIEGGKK